MIARLAGTLIHKQAPLMVIDVAGVGYEVEAPLPVFSDLPEIGQAIVILTHLSVKDDSHTLYGFSSEGERTVFRQLLKISGIGAKLALAILSGASGQDLARYVAERDSASLIRIPGIGKKTAERIIIELQDKLGAIPLAGSVAGGGGPALPADALSEAITALITLGDQPQDSSPLARNVAECGMNVEDIIRFALQSRVKP